MARGIDLIEWTFDPLEIKNAYFNVWNGWARSCGAMCAISTA
jgi:predicted GNAT superfamily acetyltransferase